MKIMKKMHFQSVSFILFAAVILFMLLTGCSVQKMEELESFKEPEIKISELPEETTTEPPTQPPTTKQPETTTEAPTQPPVKIRVIFDDNGADKSTFKVQTFEEGISGQFFTGEIEKAGYTFQGWTLDKDSTKSQYSMNSGVSDSWLLDMKSQYGDTVMLYAVWEGPVYSALTPGDVNEDVGKMQTALLQLGYYESGIDGSYGPATARAVALFRADQGLAVEGGADLEMLSLLYQQAADTTSEQEQE